MLQRLGVVLYLLCLGFAIVMLFPLFTALVYSLLTGVEQLQWGLFASGSLFFIALAVVALLLGMGARRFLAGP